MSSVASNNRPSFLKLDQLTKVYAGRPAVDALSLNIQEGEFISLLGPSGGGKTTTLHMIAGFIQPDGGDLLLEGRSIRDLPSHRRGAAMVFQNYALFPHMTVFDNVAFGLRMQKQPRAAIRQRVGEALALVQLDGLEQRYPLELSGGQQQRVALARAIVLQPRLLLLDEPLSNLDPRLRQELRDNFVEIHRLTGMTTLLVTHDLEEAFITSDRVAILGEGRLQQFDTPRNIYTRPQTAFVANFVGHTNRLHGSLVTEGDQYFLQLERSTTRIRLPGKPAPGISGYALPTHALRLEGLLRDLGPEQAISHLQARITSLHYLGTLLRFELDLNGLKLVGETSTHSLLQALQVGDQVTAGLLASDLIPLPGEAAA